MRHEFLPVFAEAALPVQISYQMVAQINKTEEWGKQPARAIMRNIQGALRSLAHTHMQTRVGSAAAFLGEWQI